MKDYLVSVHKNSTRISSSIITASSPLKAAEEAESGPVIFYAELPSFIVYNGLDSDMYYRVYEV